MDELEDSRRLVADEELPFRILSAKGIPVVADYGLVHEHGGPGGGTIAVPAQILVRSDGSIAWSRVARRISDRASPAETLAAVASL